MLIYGEKWKSPWQQHSCTSYTFYIGKLNGTYFFHSVIQWKNCGNEMFLDRPYFSELCAPRLACPRQRLNNSTPGIQTFRQGKFVCSFMSPMRLEFASWGTIMIHVHSRVTPGMRLSLWSTFRFYEWGSVDWQQGCFFFIDANAVLYEISGFCLSYWWAWTWCSRLLQPPMYVMLSTLQPAYMWVDGSWCHSYCG